MSSKAKEATIERLLAYWRFHKGFDANMADLAKYAGVSRDTLYRWLNRKAVPKDNKLKLINQWLDKKEGIAESTAEW